MSAVKRALTEYAIRGLISVSNLLVSLQPARPIRLLVTDPWSRIAPFVTAMNDVELVMTRRREVRSVGWYAWRKRIRFHRKLEYADGAILRMAHTRAHAYMREWKSIETAPFLRDFFLYGDISLWDAVRPALAAIIARAQEDIAVIESTKKIFTRNRINCVLLFASNKGYNNTVARLSEILGIPSIELQHAHELNEPSHPYARIRTQYLAAYGEMTKRACEQLPENVGKVIPCGSPRLDAHSRPVSAEVRERMRLQLRLAPGAPVLFAVVPPIYLSLEHTGFSSYYVQGMLEDFSALKRTLPDTQLILKLRPWTIRQQFYDRDETRSLFGTGTTFAQYEDIKTLLALSDVVVSGTSTVAVEAMLLHKPVLLYVPRAIDHTFEEFERAGAIVMARTREDFFAHATRLLSSKEERDRLVARADQFIKKNFLLDGTASERVAHLIRNTVAGSAIR